MSDGESRYNQLLKVFHGITEVYFGGIRTVHWPSFKISGLLKMKTKIFNYHLGLNNIKGSYVKSNLCRQFRKSGLHWEELAIYGHWSPIDWDDNVHWHDHRQKRFSNRYGSFSILYWHGNPAKVNQIAFKFIGYVYDEYLKVKTSNIMKVIFKKTSIHIIGYEKAHYLAEFIIIICFDVAY